MITRITFTNIYFPSNMSVKINGSKLNINGDKYIMNIKEYEARYNVSFCWTVEGNELKWNKKINKTSGSIECYLKQLLHFCSTFCLDITGMLTYTVLTNDIHACDVGIAYIKNNEITVVHLDHQIKKDKFPTNVSDLGKAVSYTTKYNKENLFYN